MWLAENELGIEGLIFTEMNTQTESEMIPKFWIIQEHLRDIRDDSEVLDPLKDVSASASMLWPLDCI